MERKALHVIPASIFVHLVFSPGENFGTQSLAAALPNKKKHKKGHQNSASLASIVLPKKWSNSIVFLALESD